MLLEESGDKLLLLENLLNEKDSNLTDFLEEMSELRDSSAWLSSELESMISLNERLANDTMLDPSGDGNGLEMVRKKRSQLLERLKDLRLKKQSRLKATEFIIMNRATNKSISSTKQVVKTPTSGDIQKRRRQVATKRAGRHQKDGSLFEELNDSMSRTSPTGSSSAPDGEDEDVDAELNEMSEDLLIEIYAQLKMFHNALRLRKESFNNQSNTNSNNNNNNITLMVGHQQHLYSPNSTEDSGISGDDSKFDVNTCSHKVCYKPHTNLPSTTTLISINSRQTRQCQRGNRRRW